MKITQYGPGDPQTWGGCSPYPSDDDELKDKIAEQLSSELYGHLEEGGFEMFHDLIILTDRFDTLVERRVEEYKEEVEERKIEDHLDAENRW